MGGVVSVVAELPAELEEFLERAELSELSVAAKAEAEAALHLSSGSGVPT